MVVAGTRLLWRAFDRSVASETGDALAATGRDVCVAAGAGSDDGTADDVALVTDDEIAAGVTGVGLANGDESGVVAGW